MFFDLQIAQRLFDVSNRENMAATWYFLHPALFYSEEQIHTLHILPRHLHNFPS